MKITEIKQESDFDLISYNTLRISSIADIAYFPSSVDELLFLLETLNSPLIIGRGSNILLSSFGIKRPVIITKNLDKISYNDPILELEAGCYCSIASKKAFELSLSGFEFLSGLPATIGGAVCMNAGANNQDISDCFVEAMIYDINEKKIKTFSKEDMEFSYRNSKLKNQNKYVLISAKFELKKTLDINSVQNLMDLNIEKRKNMQPSLKEPNLGCAFKNPKNTSAGKLLDEAKLKNCIVGGAKVSIKHANFIINYNNSTSLDYLNLMKKMQDEVKNKYNIKLEPEIIYEGNNEKEMELWKTIK